MFRRDHRRSRPALGLQGWSPALHTQEPRSPWRHTPGLSQATSAPHCSLPPRSQSPERRKCEISLLRESTWSFSKKLVRAGSRPAGFQQEQVLPRTSFPSPPSAEGKTEKKAGTRSLERTVSPWRRGHLHPETRTIHPQHRQHCGFF